MFEKTVSTVTIQDIINETGLSQGGIYRFYKDLDEIFGDMILSMRERVSIKERVDKILEKKDCLTPSQKNTYPFPVSDIICCISVPDRRSLFHFLSTADRGQTVKLLIIMPFALVFK